MKFYSNSFNNGDMIPEQFAFGVIDPVNHVALSENKNPHLAWSDLPKGTRSLALICHDGDVPSRGDAVNQEGKTVPAAACRAARACAGTGRHRRTLYADAGAA